MKKLGLALGVAAVGVAVVLVGRKRAGLDPARSPYDNGDPDD